MFGMRLSSFWAVGALCLAILGANDAQAVTAKSVACSDAQFAIDVTNRLTGVSACEISPGLANDKVADMNAAMFFGFNDWTFREKLNFPDGFDPNNPTYDHEVGGAGSIGFSIEGRGTGNPENWSVSLPNLTGIDLMIVLKGGNKALPNATVAYLANAVSGTYLSTFFDEKNGVFNVKEISHMSVYTRGSISDVPLPASLPLLLVGIGGLALLRRRQRGA